MTEILFEIFDYLSGNDAVYAFFCFNERLKVALIQHQHVLRSFQLPKSNLTYWENILPMIEGEAEWSNHNVNITPQERTFDCHFILSTNGPCCSTTPEKTRKC